MSSRTAEGSARRPDWVGACLAAVVVCAFLHNLSVSWLKWGDPVVDGGREMMTPARMLDGEALYTDQRNAYGPLAPYVNSALYRLFGVRLSVLQGAGIATAALMTLAIYALSRRFLGRAVSAVLAVVFLYVCAFGHLTPNPSFNFVLPYAYAATYGILAATWSLVFLIRYVQLGRERDLAWSVAGLALAALGKLEAVLPAATAHAAFLAVSFPARHVHWRQLRLYAAGIGAVAAVYGLLFLRAGPALWTDNLAILFNPGMRSYAAETMGLDRPVGSLLGIGVSALMLGLALGVAAAAGRWLERDHAPALRWAALALPPILAFLVYAAVGSDLALRVLPVLAIAAIVLSYRRLRRDLEGRGDSLSELVLWAFAAACLARLGLHARASHYGFFLAPVPLAALGVLLCRNVPRALAAGGRARAVLVATGAAVLAGIAAAAFLVSRAQWAEHDMNVSTPRGHMVLRGERWQPRVVAYLSGIPDGARVAVIPQGAGLLFLAGARMWGGLYFYAPMEYAGRYADARVVERLGADPPDYVVVLAQDPGSFRYTGFGVDFGWLTATWLREHCVAVAGEPEVAILRCAEEPSRGP